MATGARDTLTDVSDHLDNTGDVSPLRELWTVAWPTVLTMTSYTIMQFVDGRPLDSIIKEVGQLPIPMVQTVMTRVGEALG